MYYIVIQRLVQVNMSSKNLKRNVKPQDNSSNSKTSKTLKMKTRSSVLIETTLLEKIHVEDKNVIVPFITYATSRIDSPTFQKIFKFDGKGILTIF